VLNKAKSIHMITYFISRHPGAIEWAQQQGLPFDQQLRHLDINIIQAGDRVIGSLPVNHAASVCAKGARYFHLSLDLPADKRGQELSVDDMHNYGAEIEEFWIEQSRQVSSYTV